MPSVVNAAVMAANVSARMPKRYLKRRMYEFSGRCQQRPEVVDADGDAKAVGQGDRED